MSHRNAAGRAVLLGALLAFASCAASVVRPELARHIAIPGDAPSRIAGAFVLYDEAANRYIRLNPERCAERFIPASTFKIFNAMAAIDAGAVTDENTVYPWDGTVWGVPEWNADQSLADAFRNSTVWYFQEVARRVGAERMSAFLQANRYGNQSIEGGIDRFWLDGGLAISANEQVEFLRRLRARRLSFSERAMETVDGLLVVERGANYTLRAKTGWTFPDNVNAVGWVVGWVERGDSVSYYAMNVSTDDLELPQKTGLRVMAFGILRELGVLP